MGCAPGMPCWENTSNSEDCGNALTFTWLPCGCALKVNSTDVIYTGSNLPNTGIETNDNLTLALSKIDAAILIISNVVLSSRTLTINGLTQDLSADRTWTVGDVLTSGSYANPSWITSLAYSKITGVPPFITLNDLSGGTGILYNNLTGVITNSLPDQVVTLTSGANVSITGTYPNFTIASTGGGGGGGVTNTAANNEIPKSNGVNIIPSGIFSTTLGNIIFGTGLTGATRTFTADGTATDVGFIFTPKGAGSINISTLSGVGTGIITVDSTGNLGRSNTIVVTNALTVDNSSLQLNSGTTYDGSVAKTISVKPLGITNSLIANSTIDLTTKVTGILPIANGGTNKNSYTPGSVLYFDGTRIQEDNTNLFWNNTNKRLGIGTASPVTTLTIGGIVSLLNGGFYLSTFGRNANANGTILWNNGTGSNLALVETATPNVYAFGSALTAGSAPSNTVLAMNMSTGTISIPNYTTANGILYTNGSGVISQATIGSLPGLGTNWGTALSANLGSGWTTALAATYVSGAISGLTTNRIPYATSSTTLGDSTNFTWDNTHGAVTISNIRIHSTGSSSNNTFIGNLAGNFTASAGGNTCVGLTSGQNITSGAFNTFIGNLSGNLTTTGVNNVALGNSAYQQGTTGNQNVAIGRLALSNTTGDWNSALGDQAGSNLTSGSNNLILGSRLNVQSATTSDQLTIQNAIFGLSNSSTNLSVSQGFIGIYQPTPSYCLHVSGNTTNGNIFLTEDIGGNNILEIIKASGINQIGFFASSPVAQQSVNTILVNNVTSGGTVSVIADFTNLTTYSTDAPTIRNDIFRLTEKVLKLETALRNYGLATN